jgi:tetratricopeptide (TPR) repeat protein
LLVYLALNADRAHRRERLAGLLWSDGNDSKARRGEFLEGFWIRGAHGFEEWAGRERARLAALARDALRQSIRTARGHCDWPEVQGRAEWLVQLDPFDETAYAELMRALWMIGDRSAALDSYEKLKRVLATELESTPSQETEALATRIRQRSVRGGWASQRMLRENERSPFRDPPFVGRKRELAALAEEWDRVATGETRAVALVGGAGIGKTRLADEFLKSLELDQVTILQGRCHEAELSLPYGPVAEALRQAVERIDLGDVNPLWLAELARIIPEVHERYGELPEPARLDAEGGRRRLYEGVAQVLRAACESVPVLLFVDDLHWSDDSSLALLHYLHRRVSNGLYLLTAHRPEDLAARKSSTGAELLSGRNSQVRTLYLEGLDRSESSDLLAALVGTDENLASVSTVREMSGGNPFFAIELARSLAEDGEIIAPARPQLPDSIRTVLDRRLADLSDRAVALMQQAAILGSRVSHEVLSSAAGQSPQEVNATIRELTRADVLIEENDLLRFRHDLIRELALGQISTTLARALHLKAARAQIKTKKDNGEIATHLSAAGDTRRAYAYALRGAEAAEQLFALEEAAELLHLASKHAPSESTRMDLVGRLGKLFLHMREYAKARPLLKERLEHVSAGSAGLAVLEAQRDLLFVDIYSSSLSLQEGVTALKAFHSEFSERGLDAPRLEADILRALFWATVRSFNPRLVEDTISKIRSLHERCTQPDVRCRTARNLGIYECYMGRLEEAESLLTQALAWANEAKDQTAIVDCYVGLSALLHRNMRRELAERILEIAVPLAEQHADPALIASLLCNCAVFYMYLHDLEKARSLLGQARQVFESTGAIPDTSPSITFNLGFVAHLQGDEETAEACWASALRTGEEDGLLTTQVECLTYLGHLALHHGRITEARDLAARALRLARPARFSLMDQRLGLEELVARLRYRKGHRDKALRRLLHVISFAESGDVPLYLTLQLTLVELFYEEGRTADAQAAKKQLCAVALEHDAMWWAQEAEQLRDPREQLSPASR